MSEISYLINKYQMQAHPEGGYFVESYRSEQEVGSSRGHRSASTAIYFLITKDNISHFHRLTSDEGWHFYTGSPLKIIQISSNGRLLQTIMGNNDKQGEVFQHYIPAGDWFASESLGDYSFVGCTVSPGFEFEDFEMAKLDCLLEHYPQHADIIQKYTKK